MEPMPSSGVAPRARRDYRALTLLVLLALLVPLGYAFSWWANRVPDVSTAQPRPPAQADHTAGFATLPALSALPGPPIVPAPELPGKSADPAAIQAAGILREAGRQINAQQFDRALTTLHEARPLLMNNPQAFLLIGRALEGRKDYATARDFYRAALDRNPYLADAYWGFATTSENLGDLPSALGAMRSYLHTEKNPDPYRLRVAQARSAIWEWESQLGRGAWGPTKGIPPGFTAAELKRDGRGVAIKMPLPESQRADGTTDYEIKHADRFPMFKP